MILSADEQRRRRLALQAATHAYLYASAVKFEAAQLLAPESSEAGHEDIADLLSAGRQARALMLILALRNLLRAAEMAERCALPPEAVGIQQAIARFRQAIPDLVRARDVLEHFDDYLEGNGRTSVVYDIRFERADSRYAVCVGGARIDVAAALEEARHLSGNAVAAAHNDWKYPVGNEVRAGK